MLTIDQLSAGYDGKPLFPPIDFTLPTREHCLILGPSGSGKTTLLYALAGLLTPLTGDVHLNGTNYTALTSTARDAFRGRHLGIIYQTLHMVPALSVRENLLLVQYAAGIPQDKAHADALLTALGLADHTDAAPQTLSHGQLQRVAIARAAMNRPSLLLGDEPTSALDDHACAAVMEMLLATAEASGASLIIATHDARIKPYFTHTLTLGTAHA